MRSGWPLGSVRGGEMAEAEAWLEELPYDECLDLLRQASIGRIASSSTSSPSCCP
jgi:hypothetical protein